jgi:hypothetical protein
LRLEGGHEFTTSLKGTGSRSGSDVG